MTRFLSISLLVFLFGCGSNDVEQQSNATLRVGEGTEALSFTESAGSIMANKNCESIFVKCGKFPFRDAEARFEMWLTTNGDIREIVLLDLSPENLNRHYKSADFIASKALKINDFSFSESTRTLSFGFEGFIYSVLENGDSLFVAGSVSVDDLSEVPCNETQSQMEAVINGSSFDPVNVQTVSTRTNHPDGTASTYKGQGLAYSDDGFSIRIVTDEPMEDLTVGTYQFSRTDTLNIVSLLEYIGSPKADLSSESIWRIFECEGELIIDEQVKQSKTVTIGTFHFDAYHNSQLMYEVQNGSFSFVKF
jgi:hypothetical protein